jgi:hypothetical protein
MMLRKSSRFICGEAKPRCKKLGEKYCGIELEEKLPSWYCATLISLDRNSCTSISPIGIASAYP